MASKDGAYRGNNAEQGGSTGHNAEQDAWAATGVGASCCRGVVIAIAGWEGRATEHSRNSSGLSL